MIFRRVRQRQPYPLFTRLLARRQPVALTAQTIAYPGDAPWGGSLLLFNGRDGEWRASWRRSARDGRLAGRKPPPTPGGPVAGVRPLKRAPAN